MEESFKNMEEEKNKLAKTGNHNYMLFCSYFFFLDLKSEEIVGKILKHLPNENKSHKAIEMLETYLKANLNTIDPKLALLVKITKKYELIDYSAFLKLFKMN